MLVDCLDPIVKSARLNSRCLIASHCSELNNTVCKADDRVPVRTPVATTNTASDTAEVFRSCQCIDGFTPASSGRACDPDPDIEILLSNSCAEDDECANIANSICNLVSLDPGSFGQTGSETFIGTCQCMAGYIPLYEPTSGSLRTCRDPIVSTSTVHGICIEDRHCTGLPR